MSVHDLTIRHLGPKGDGIHVSPEGRVYVERTVPGDRVRARVRVDEMGIARGEIVEILEPSHHRQPAPCSHYDVCGNCTLQHVQETYYRTWKNQIVVAALHKERLKPGKQLKTIYIDEKNRRRATFAALSDRGELTMGYYRRRSRQIADIDSCLVADPKILALREAILPFLPRLLRDGRVVDIFVQVVDDAADLVLTGPVGARGVPDDTVLGALEELMEASLVVRASWRAREGDRQEVVLEKGKIVATFGALEVELPPAAFMQATTQGERALVGAVMGALPREGRFADLFSGCGTFTGPMLARGPVDAYEAVPTAVAALTKARGAENELRVFQRDLFEEPLRREEINRYDAVVFDPPRGGCPEQTATMSSARTPTLVGVSCNPATFARDARLLCDGGYTFESVQIIDQFNWSHHVEVVGVFHR